MKCNVCSFFLFCVNDANGVIRVNDCSIVDDQWKNGNGWSKNDKWANDAEDKMIDISIVIM